MYRLATCFWVSDLHTPTGFVGCAEKLLIWGFCINLDMERERGTNVELNYATNDDIDEIFNEKNKSITSLL